MLPQKRAADEQSGSRSECRGQPALRGVGSVIAGGLVAIEALWYLRIFDPLQQQHFSPLRVLTGVTHCLSRLCLSISHPEKRLMSHTCPHARLAPAVLSVLGNAHDCVQ